MSTHKSVLAGNFIYHKVSVLVEGQALPLTQLAQHISCKLSSNRSNCVSSTQVAENGDAGSSAEGATPAGEAAAADAHAPTTETAKGGSEGAVSALIVRNLIQDVASRKSYGLLDGAVESSKQLQCWHAAAPAISGMQDQCQCCIAAAFVCQYPELGT